MSDAATAPYAGSISDEHPRFVAAYALARRSAQVRAIRTVTGGLLPVCDWQDLEQEALIHVWLALPKYDPVRAGLHTFVEAILRTQFASMIRSYALRPVFVPMGERHLGSTDTCHEIELRADIRRVLAGVSVFDRAVAMSLAQSSAVETSRHLNISRAAAYRAIERLRLAFTAAGFGSRRRVPNTVCRPNCDVRIGIRQRGGCQ
jgi:DNA-directed RNA polymerase specialized sigma24 family protein